MSTCYFACNIQHFPSLFLSFLCRAVADAMSASFHDLTIHCDIHGLASMLIVHWQVQVWLRFHQRIRFWQHLSSRGNFDDWVFSSMNLRYFSRVFIFPLRVFTVETTSVSFFLHLFCHFPTEWISRVTTSVSRFCHSFTRSHPNIERTRNHVKSRSNWTNIWTWWTNAFESAEISDKTSSKESEWMR